MVRCMVECESCAAMQEMLELLLAHGDIEVMRVKDRLTHPTPMAWADVMMNFRLRSDANQHVCEVQIVHKKLLLARSGLGGHGPYAKVRAASEILEVVEAGGGGAGGGGASGGGAGGASVASGAGAGLIGGDVGPCTNCRTPWVPGNAFCDQCGVARADDGRRREAERIPPAELVGRRIEVHGKGAGQVQGPFKKGALFGMGPSKHRVELDSGRTETVLLRRHGNGGMTFVME
jgi:hypothetical protein